MLILFTIVMIILFFFLIYFFLWIDMNGEIAISLAGLICVGCFVLGFPKIINFYPLKAYSDGSFIQLEGEMVSVKIIKGQTAHHETFNLSEVNLYEASTDENVQIVDHGKKAVKKGEKRYSIYLSMSDYERLQRELKEIHLTLTEE